MVSRGRSVNCSAWSTMMTVTFQFSNFSLITAVKALLIGYLVTLMSSYKDWLHWNKPLPDEDLLAAALEISEEQAVNSDIGGDSNADDELERTTTKSPHVGLN
ncbi:hypothetical protein FQR65_LT18228 [Abscondita terminalis]|nr:hypothetical protein FQR65_LT18228 [Abscondita terminalis]